MSKAEQKEATIRSLYTELNKFGANGEYDKALKSANKILTLDQNEQEAAKCKLVCLIQISKFEEVIKYLDRVPVPDSTFERAYSQYRLNQPEQAYETIQSCGLNPLPANLKELRAQVLYRLERYEECFDLYRDIIKNTHDDYDDERMTNMSAVAANLCIEGSTKELPNLREDTYELTYNGGCALAGKQQYPEAEKKLRASEKLCREFLEEDGATEEDIMDEVAIIKVQLAYCLQMQGKAKEASTIYTDVLRHKTNDAALTAVISNNLVVINRDQNMFDSKKKMKVATSEQAEHKLTARQKKVIAFNNCLLAFFTNQADCSLLASRLCNNYPDLEFRSLLIRASQQARDKKFKDAVELLDSYAKKQPKEQPLEIKFAVVQLQLLAGNRKAAVEILESLGEAKYRPGVVSALVTLYLGLENKNAASDILKNAVEWYKKNKSGAGGDLTDMWRQAASFHLRGGEAETAAKSLEELLKTNPTDMKILAQLVIAYAQFNPKKAQEASKKLPALDTLTTAAEIDALEATNWMMIAKAVKKKLPASGRTDQSPGTPGTDAAKVKKQKKKRKGKLPKNYDASAVPDPERWLPRYERTGYRKKRDRRVKEVMKGSQGTASGQADQFDMSKAYNQSKQSPAVPAPIEALLASAAAPRQLPRKSQHKKKKGKH